MTDIWWEKMIGSYHFYNKKKIAGSNDKTLINGIPGNSENTYMSLDPTETIKTLGVHWDSQNDSIVYTVIFPIQTKQ